MEGDASSPLEGASASSSGASASLGGEMTSTREFLTSETELFLEGVKETQGVERRFLLRLFVFFT